MTTKQYAMPEWLTRHDIEGGAWAVEEGQPIRGDAWTQILGRRMRIPTGDDEASRVVRAHEMMHAKVSPSRLHMDGRYRATSESVVVAEEARVNHLVGRAGFNIDELVDGSEHRSGEIAGQNSDWNGSVRFLAACVGTKGTTAYLRGVKKTNPEMAESLNVYLKELKKWIRRHWGKRPTRILGKTTPVESGFTVDDDMIPAGFRFAIALAQWIDGFLRGSSGDVEMEADFPDANEVKQGSSGGLGRFAPLRLAQLPMPNRVDGQIGRRKAPAQIGRNPRRINRMLMDPERRVFDRKTRGNGGVVLIDMSGSMSLSQDNLWAILNAAPGCVVIGYSHRPGSTVPNTFLLADRGRVVETIPEGNGGNGVDGPALTYAQSKRRQGEPLIWVCDGYVTDGDSDGYYGNLATWCAEFVVKHRVHMVQDVEGAVEALRKSTMGHLPVEGCGPLAGAVNRLLLRQS